MSILNRIDNMITFLYGNSEFNDLLQECYLADTSILTGIEYLIKAELYNNDDGLFYSSFFSLSIGIERFLKIALVTEFMYSNNFKKPTEKLLKEPGHNLIRLFNQFTEVSKKYDISIPPLDTTNPAYNLIKFISAYATKNRYQNLDKLTNKHDDYDRHPIHEWLKISESYLRSSTKIEKIETDLLKYYNKYNHPTIYTNYLDFDGHPLLYVDLLQYRFIVNKAKPYILNCLIQTLKPIYIMLDNISMECNNGENTDLIGPVKIPYYGELFPIFYADLDLFKRVKKWVGRYK